MSGLPYYKAYPRDFMDGTIGMDFELKGAYRLALDLIYMQGGLLPDDARYIAGQMGCSVKKWNSLRDKLVALGKLEVRGSYLANNRADKELESLGKFAEKQRENRSRPNKNKDIPSPRFDHTEPDTDTDKGGGGSACAPEGFFEEVSRLTGLSGPENRAEAEGWLDLEAITPKAALEQVRHVLADAPQVRSLSYFTPAMRRLSQRLTAPPPQQVERPPQRASPRPDLTFDLSKFTDDGTIKQ